MAIVAIDIETVPREGIMDTWYPAWAAEKFPGVEGEELESKAALFPEFGQVCCISYTDADRHGTIIKNRVAGSLDEERDLLQYFADNMPWNTTLVGHNLKGFDIPFIVKRCMAHGLKVPEPLQILGKKPWEVKHLDTMELLRFGSANMSLRSACLLLGLDDPKSDTCGAKVWDMYRDGKLDSIAKYCDGDVEAVRGIYLKLRDLVGGI